MELCEEATQLLYPVRFSKVQQDLLEYSDYSIIIIPLMRIICKSVNFFCLLIIKNTLILAHV